ncbi:MAG: ATP-binding protein [Spirochaetaceae bacterium]|jgi:predicted ATP-dependent endonuclease of OLD family|nr:ATP-binding protein [Spirochaetaceae bacterium]
MYLTLLKIKNYKLIESAEISFQRGMNVLVGKNSTGKSTVLEAINFLLSPYVSIPLADVIPYEKRNVNVSPSVEGYFELSKTEINEFLNTGIEPDVLNDYERILADFRLKITKTIVKRGKSSYTVNTRPDIDFKNHVSPSDSNKANRILNAMMPKINMNNVIVMPDSDSLANEQILPEQVLIQSLPMNQMLIYQHLRGLFYTAKQRENGEYTKIQKALQQASDIKDIDIDFDPVSAQLNIFFQPSNSKYKVSLNAEGRGIREYFYLFLALFYFQDTVILKDEALVHMHKSLLTSFLAEISEQPYQMIVTSHIKELINSLDFGNIIICRKDTNKAEITNLLQHNDIREVLDELGYADKISDNILEMEKNVFG